MPIHLSGLISSKPLAHSSTDGGKLLALDLADCLGWDPMKTKRERVPLVVVELRDQRVALRVEQLAGQLEIYVKPVPALFSGLRKLAGLTVLGSGEPVFLLDVGQLA